jgi:hypothetical protein
MGFAESAHFLEALQLKLDPTVQHPQASRGTFSGQRKGVPCTPPV